MWAKHLKIAFLMIAGLTVLVSTVIPHHHHEDGAICLLLVDSHHAHDGEEGDTDCCGDDCLQRMSATNAPTSNHSDPMRFAPVQLLLGTWAVLCDMTVDEAEESFDYGVYHERLHSILFSQALSLRAPPVA